MRVCVCSMEIILFEASLTSIFKCNVYLRMCVWCFVSNWYAAKSMTVQNTWHDKIFQMQYMLFLCCTLIFTHCLNADTSFHAMHKMRKRKRLYQLIEIVFLFYFTFPPILTVLCYSRCSFFITDFVSVIRTTLNSNIIIHKSSTRSAIAATQQPK